MPGLKIEEMYVEIRADLQKLEREMRTLDKRLQRVGKQPTIDFDTTLAKRKISELVSMRSRLEQVLKKKIAMNADLVSINRTRSALQSVNNALEGLVPTTQKSTNALKSMAVQAASVIGRMAGAASALKFGQHILQTASEFESLRTRLVSLYGDVDKAAEVFKKFQDIASTTPYSLKNVVQAGASLKAFGLDAENTLKAVTDLAAFMNIDVVDAANAVGRAFAGGAGAADVLRERGVLNLIKDFKKIDDLTNLTLPEFRKALIETMESPIAGIAGSTDRLSKTFSGAMSNMMDAVDNFAAALGGGALSGLKNLVRQVTTLIAYITPVTSSLDEAKQKAFELSYRFNDLSGTLLQLKEKSSLTKEELNLYNNTIEELQRTYPNYLKNIDLHKAGLEEVRKALDGARTSLNEYIDALLRQAVIDKHKQKIADLASELGTYTTILTGLKNAQKELEATGVDPFSKLTAAQRNFLNEQGDVVYQYRTANIFMPLTEQIAAVEKRIEELGKKRSTLTQTINDMMKAFTMPQAPKSPTPQGASSIAGPAVNSLINLNKQLEELKAKRSAVDIHSTAFKQLTEQIQKLETQIKSVTDTEQKQLDQKTQALHQYYNAVRFEDSTYKAYRTSLIIQEYEEFLQATNDKLAAEKLFYLRMKELHEDYIKWRQGKNIKLTTVNEPAKPTIEENNDLLYYTQRLEQGVFGENGSFVQSAELAMDAARGFVDGFFSDIVIQGEWANSMLEKAFASMADAVIRQIQRMAAEWLAFQALKSVFSKIGIPIPGGASGGEFVGTSRGVKRMSGGGSFIVPEGFPNDSYPLLVQSGERVSVTKSSTVNAEQQMYDKLLTKLDLLNIQLLDMSTQTKEEKLRVDLKAQLEGSDLWFATKRASRIQSRFRGM